MRLSRVVLCLGLMFAAGCTSTEWVNVNNSKSDYAIDYRKCEEEGYNNPKFQGGMKLILQEHIDRCMNKIGWRLREIRE